ncbi:transposase [Streptomyces sp. NPDC006446]|uniref:transposase n=1 Tax=Streptomyces sp. NPDC006446 TaxID=3154301 RepID=UPI0033A3912C
MFEPFARADQHRGGAYLWELLLDGRWKSVEPIAAWLGKDGNRQARVDCISSSPRDAAHVRARLAWRMQQVIKPTTLIIMRGAAGVHGRDSGRAVGQCRSVAQSSPGPR